MVKVIDARRAIRSALALFLLASMTLVGAPAMAAAVPGCVLQTNGVALLNLDNSGDPYVLQMKNDKFLVNGVSCGEPIHVFIQDEGDVTSDHIIFDLTTPFRADGDFMTVQLNLKSHSGGQDTIEVWGAKTKDRVELRHGGFTVFAPQPYAPNDSFRLFMGIPQIGNVKMIFKLRGGNDRFDMVVNNAGRTHEGPVIVNGGAGRDKLNGSLGKQKLEGGKGSDVINGKQGPDKLYGNGGDDEISGGKGSDFIHGGSGEDSATGGSGADEGKMNDGEVDSFDGGAGNKDTCKCDGVDNVVGVP